MTKRRKTLNMHVVVTVPSWCTAQQARAAVRDYLNSSNNWDLEGPDWKSGTLRAKSVKAAPRA